MVSRNSASGVPEIHPPKIVQKEANAALVQVGGCVQAIRRIPEHAVQLEPDNDIALPEAGQHSTTVLSIRQWLIARRRPVNDEP